MTQPVRLRNLTPHTISIELADGSCRDLRAEFPTPRCTIVREPVGPVVTDVGEIVLVTTRLLGHVDDLPERSAHTILVVARQVAEAAPDRDDLVFPDDLVREPNTGRVLRCRALGRLR